MTLDHPALLALLIALPFLRRPSHPALLFNCTTGLPQSARQRLLHLPRTLRLAAIALLILALSGPRLQGRHVRELSHTTGLQLVVDCSGSMLNKDMTERGRPAARIDVVRDLSRDFIFGDGRGLKGRPLDMIGVIAFAEEPVTLCPLTISHESLRPAVSAIRVGSNADGTAIGDAIAVAAARFHQAETSGGDKFKSTAIILLTDGDNNMGSHSVSDAAALAEQWGVRVYAIAIRPGGADPSMQSLQHLAEVTGGKAQLVGNGEALRSVYQEIDALEKSDVGTSKLTGGRELMYALALAALGFQLVGVLLSETWLRRLP